MDNFSGYKSLNIKTLIFNRLVDKNCAIILAI